MRVQWEYHKEEYKKGKKDHVNHLWYISTIDETEADYGVEAEVFSTDNGPFMVTLYKGDTRNTPTKVKTLTFKTLPAAKKTAKAWLLKGLKQYINHMEQIMLAIHDLK